VEQHFRISEQVQMHIRDDGSAQLFVRENDSECLTIDLTSDEVSGLARALVIRGRQRLEEAKARPTIDDIDRRLAALESSVRKTDHRINMAAEAMRECSLFANMHPSVKFLADTLAINFDRVGTEVANTDHSQVAEEADRV
jgi:hypothetical protein